MKRSLALSAVLLLAAFVVAAEPPAPRRLANPLLNDVMQMTRAGLPDDTIVAYVKARQTRLGEDVTADDLIRLQRAGVSDKVVRFVAGAAGLQAGPSAPDQEMTYDSNDSNGDRPAQPSYSEDEAYDSSVDAYGYPYGYDSYPYWYAYSPYFSGTVIVGGFGRSHFFHGGHFHGGHVHRGGQSHGSSGHSHSGGHGHR